MPYKPDCPKCIGDGYFDPHCPYCDDDMPKHEAFPKATEIRTPLGRAELAGSVAGQCKECDKEMDEKHPMYEAIEKGLCGKCCDNVAQVQNDLCP